MHQQHDLAAALLDVDVDGVGLLGEVAGDVLDDGLRLAADDAVALAGDLVLEVVVIVVVALVEVGLFVAHDGSSVVASSALASGAGALSAGGGAAAGDSGSTGAAFAGFAGARPVT